MGKECLGIHTNIPIRKSHSHSMCISECTLHINHFWFWKDIYTHSIHWGPGQFWVFKFQLQELTTRTNFWTMEDTTTKALPYGKTLLSSHQPLPNLDTEANIILFSYIIWRYLLAVSHFSISSSTWRTHKTTLSKHINSTLIIRIMQIKTQNHFTLIKIVMIKKQSNMLAKMWR